MQNTRISVKERRPRLERYGVDLEYFPGYSRPEPYLHSVDVVLLTLVVRGQGRHYMESDMYEEHGGSLAITHYGQFHSLVTGAGTMDVMNMYLDPQRHALPRVPGEFSRVLSDLIPQHPSMGNLLNRIVRVQFDDATPVVNLAFAMLEELDGGREGCAQVVQHLLSVFLIHCCRHVLEKGLVRSISQLAHGAPALERVRAYLDATAHEHHSLAALAARAGFSPTYLCRAFRKYTGRTLFEYINDRRIQSAMIALRNTDDKILSIALDCGFFGSGIF